MRQYKLGLYEKSMPGFLTIQEKLQVAKRCGYDYLELSIDESQEKLARLDWTDHQIAEVRTAMEETELPILSICLSGHRKYPLGHRNPSVQQQSLEIMEKAIRLSAKLGVRIIQLAGYDVYYEPGTEETRANFARNLRLCVEKAAQAGVILAFETMELEFLNTVKKAMSWVDRMESPYLQVYPDAGNITNAAASCGASVLDDLETGRGHIVAVHLKETVPGVYREVPYGTGHVNFLSVAEKSIKLGVRLFLAEFWYIGQESWENDIVQNCRFLRDILDAAAGQKASVHA